jgi:predicted AAA+ superfamily ATPase
VAITNHERVGKGVELLKQGLAPFVEREFKASYRTQVQTQVSGFLHDDPMADKPIGELDASLLLKLMWASWNDVFKKTLGQAERSLVIELKDARNRWAHQETFSSDDAYRALDSIGRLLTAVSAPEAQEVEKVRMELLRVRFDEQARSEKRKSAGTAIESQGAGNLKPWREIVTPHADVASGRYQQAEFAADLWQVHQGEGADEYRKPVEFFRRTYLTESLKQLLVRAVERLTGQGGDPVVDLQTNFGGGKTHAMLAMYHLFSGTPVNELAGVESLFEGAGLGKVPAVHRVVLVGNRISPGNPAKKKDGTIVRTLWGELAWQLGYAAAGMKGAKKAFELVRADDENATNPGDALHKLLVEHGPCLILIDEWVAYARQLHDAGEPELTGGTFETQFTFAQTLTEAAKQAKNCLLVVSLPASTGLGAQNTHADADDAEVGGQRGVDALERLRNVIGRIGSPWKPASAEEGFEIVRRRLFEDMVEPGQFKDRDVVARAFADLYRTQAQEFPPDCREADYERKLKAAFPIHPEVFERLYSDWSTLARFHRTRGVLRLMATVIHSLWEKGDRNPLILPASLPIDDPRVQFELTRYLSDNWTPVIEKDVDGPNSLPLQMDNDVPNLGKYAACRRVARTIYLGSAPLGTAAHKGIEDRRVKLGCVMPGEAPAVFGDALRRLAATATYLYEDGTRYWYSTQPTVTKTAEDRAGQILRDEDKVLREVDARLRANLRKTGDFARVHPLPRSGQDVPDDRDARLVVLGIDAPYSKEPTSPAEVGAKSILETRGTVPRLYRNTLVFLAADKARVQDLCEAVARYLAWESIVEEKEELNLTGQQVKQAEAQRAAADAKVEAQLPETYPWLLVPVQKSPQSAVEWQVIRVSGQDALAARASKRLRSDELLIASYAPSNLRMELDRVPLWRGDHVEIRLLLEDFARYLYLPRLAESSVLVQAIRRGFELLTWRQDSFAYAESYDEAAGRYRGLRAGNAMLIVDREPPGLLVKPDVAEKQLDAEEAERRRAEAEKGGTSPEKGTKPGTGKGAEEPGTPAPAQRPRRFHGSVTLDAARVGRDAGRIAEEVIAHLAGLPKADVTVTLEIEAELPDGAPENVVRTVTENALALKFKTQGFESE